ncbi:hypothetical protein [Actinoplanes utahensis]|uniref:Uncharacterized protein n=2 Tax=Actinoplanes utahensis TaxID=1869 RepID=A0A0A6XBF3_ACTUT|nr:hypothetical protein [Actinoplanes utahensis]KHD77417.1 hypothetical protein MB27_11855 [Actinoplanes utahensis]
MSRALDLRPNRGRVMTVATVTFGIGGPLLAASGIFLLLHLGDLRALAALRRVRRSGPAHAARCRWRA